MKPRETALRFKRFEADEQARKVADLEQMVREFESIASDLDRQIHAEEERTGVRDPAHFAYSTFAKSAAQRRDNLRASADELKMKLDVATREKEATNEQLARAAIVEPRDQTDRSRPRAGDRPAGFVGR
ncbi:MAG: flagellar export protein FliJ [Hyphomicrobium sp.]|nr:flagellar export protein FliJ [Hyphomicrobium sp.]